MARKKKDPKKLTRGEVYRPRLRIVIDPIYVQIANLSSSSTYHKYVTLVRELAARGHFIYWSVPDAEYVPNEVESLPNVGIVRTSSIQDQFVIDGVQTDQFFNLFNRTGGKFHADVVCTSRNSLALTYKRQLDPPRFHDNKGEYTDKSYGMPLVLIEEFPQTPERQHTGEAYWLSQVLGYYAADKTVFLSDHNRSEVVKAMMPFVTNSVVRDFTERAKVIPAGIEREELDKIYKPNRWKVEDGFNVLCVGRIFGPSYIEYLEWFNHFFKIGNEATLTVSLSGKFSGPMKKKLRKIGFDYDNNIGRQFKIIENNNRKNFLKMLQKYQAFVCPLSHLDHPTGLFECIYLGLPGVIPVSDYQETFFADWPWVIDPRDKVGLIAMLKDIQADPQAARDKVLPWRERIADLYDAPTNIKVLADVIENVARKKSDYFRTSRGVIDICKEMKGKEYGWADAFAYTKTAGTMGVSVGDMSMRTTFTYGRGTLNHAMHCAGYVDDCKGPMENFVRADVFDARHGGKKRRKRLRKRKSK